MAASVTLRAIGPVSSNSQARGWIPAMLTRPRVGSTPTTLLVPDGIRIELDVSVPVPKTAKLAATDVTVPPDDPPGLYRQLYALPVRPNALLFVVSLAAKSGMFVCPTITA